MSDMRWHIRIIPTLAVSRSSWLPVTSGMELYISHAFRKSRRLKATLANMFMESARSSECLRVISYARLANCSVESRSIQI